jgi:hypothetical protein
VSAAGWTSSDSVSSNAVNDLLDAVTGSGRTKERSVWTFPSLEPVIVSGGSFVLDRLLSEPGEVTVRVGDAVTSETVVARQASADRPTTLFVASELGVPNNSVSRYLTKSIGSAYQAGEVIARTRHGLRTVSVTAPSAGKLAAVEEAAGTVTFVTSSDVVSLQALVNGEVERVVPERGAVIRGSGIRIFGILGFGTEAIGQLMIGPDRPDRELTPDQVRDTWKSRIVVCGMTAGAPALNKLRQAGVAGIIVGSIAEADIRRFLAPGAAGAEMSLGAFWTGRHPEAPFAAAAASAPFVIVVTEGFGRVPMAEPVFNFLREHEGQTASIQAATCVGNDLRRPEIYITSQGRNDGQRASDELLPGRPVRLVGARDLGVVASCQSTAFQQYTDSGVATTVAQVALPSGEQRVVPVANLEVLH